MSTGYSVRFFDDGSKEDAVPREEITLSSVEPREGDFGSTHLNVGCFVVVRGRKAAVVAASQSPAVPSATTSKRPKPTVETG